MRRTQGIFARCRSTSPPQPPDRRTRRCATGTPPTRICSARCAAGCRCCGAAARTRSPFASTNRRRLLVCSDGQRLAEHHPVSAVSGRRSVQPQRLHAVGAGRRRHDVPSSPFARRSGLRLELRDHDPPSSRRRDSCALGRARARGKSARDPAVRLPRRGRRPSTSVRRQGLHVGVGRFCDVPTTDRHDQCGARQKARAHLDQH